MVSHDLSMDGSCLCHGVKIYKNNLNIDKQIIHNLAHLLYSNGNRSCLDISHVI